MLCRFETTDAVGIYKCKNCGYVTKVCRKAPYRNCGTLETIDCKHRSAEPFKQVKCKLCGSNERMVPVYKCTIHGECTLTRTKSGHDFKCCLTCGDKCPT